MISQVSRDKSGKRPISRYFALYFRDQGVKISTSGFQIPKHILKISRRIAAAKFSTVYMGQNVQHIKKPTYSTGNAFPMIKRPRLLWL